MRERHHHPRRRRALGRLERRERRYHPTPKAWNGSDGSCAVSGWSVGWRRLHESPRFGGGGGGSNRG